MIKFLKFILCIVIVLFLNCNIFIAYSENWDEAKSLNRVNNIGNAILKANKLPNNITFKVSDKEDINAYANINKEIYVYKGLLEYVTDDNELAAVIAHEIGHIVNSHSEKQTIINALLSTIKSTSNNNAKNMSIEAIKTLSGKKVSRTDEFEADLTAVDLLSNTKYSPLALISVLNKICGNYIDILQTHPSGEKRLMNIYDYCDYNYPTVMKKGYNSDSYLKAQKFIWANIKVRKQDAKKLSKFNKSQEKLKQKRLKRAKKMQNSTNPWSASLNMLQWLSSDPN